MLTFASRHGTLTLETTDVPEHKRHRPHRVEVLRDFGGPAYAHLSDEDALELARVLLARVLARTGSRGLGVAPGKVVRGPGHDAVTLNLATPVELTRGELLLVVIALLDASMPPGLRHHCGNALEQSDSPVDDWYCRRCDRHYGDQDPGLVEPL
jgi:hypothetical protein